MFGLKKHKFTAEQKKKIVHSIQTAEKATSGEIHVHVSYAKKEENILAAATQYFQVQKMHETKQRNAVLLYINPWLKKFAVYGDAQLNQKVGPTFWEKMVKDVGHAIHERDVVHGVCHAVELMGNELKTHFPYQAGGANQVSDDVSESE